MVRVNLGQKALSFCTIASAASAIAVPRHATVVSRQTAAGTSYDFIIAGGGISGLTVADRLTENSSVNVLVIESGPLDQGEDGVDIPGAYDPTAYIWPSIYGIPQTALGNKEFLAPLGRVVGGGSVVNGMVWFRSGTEEYDQRAQLGATGWAWNDLLPYFKKSENFTAPAAAYSKKANLSYVASTHGNAGPVQISYPNFYFPGSGNWYEAAVQTGLKPFQDPNDGDNVGVGWFPTTVDFTTRTRSDARDAHYDRVKNARPNYHLLTSNTVSKVLFSGTKATGVEYLPTAGGKKITATASKEVLLAAGGVHTPQLLQLSGIGPKAVLSKLGISVVADLPGVGANFQDHSTFTIPYTFSNNAVPNTGTLDTDSTYNTQQRALYDSKRKGAYVVTRGLSTNCALVPLCNATSNCQQVLSKARSASSTAYLLPGTDATVAAGYQAQRDVLLNEIGSYDHPSALITWGTGNSVSIFFTAPLSRGAITINSTDPLANPVIDWNSMVDPTDFDIVVEVFLKNRAIMTASAMKPLGAKEAAPFDGSVTNKQKIKEALIQVATPSQAHECCTAAMMPKNKGGVVNPKMQVYGVTGLRVIDISYFPTIPSAPPMAPVYASAEKIADAIKKQYSLA